MTKEKSKQDVTNLFILPFMLTRMIHNQMWISLSRFQTSRSKHRIVDKGIEFEQVDRERNWDDQIILQSLLFYVFNAFHPGASKLPIWRTDGVIFTILLHIGAVEFLYYWLHRALHHHFLYSRYHSHHHSSIVTEPITSVIHPFAEHVMYFLLFAIPLLTMVFTGTGSLLALIGYINYIDFMNNLGHCNFELIPKRLFLIFPPLKYLMYTPSFHSLHHTQFRTNYSLFMPFYDYLYGTMDASTDKLYDKTVRGKFEKTDVIHLTHPTTLQSIYHLRLGFAYLAAGPYTSKWYLWMMWPITVATMMLTWMFGTTFTVDRNSCDELKMQTWALPRFRFHYLLERQRRAINSLIEKAILEAEERGVKVVTLGLLNQDKELNENGKLYLQRHPNLKTRIVDGTSLAVAVVIHSIPKGTEQVILKGNISKMVFAISQSLCQKGIKVLISSRGDFEKLKLQLPSYLGSNLVLSSSYHHKVWLVEDGTLMDQEQRQAPKGTLFIPFSQFPIKRVRRDCIYYNTPAMVIPKSMENVHACENWLPRRVMSAWRVAGIVNAMEGWIEHECGNTVLDSEKIWHASLRHGFVPVAHP